MSDRTCSIEGCASAVKARGWCNAHYLRWAAHGDPEAVPAGQWGSLNHRWKGNGADYAALHYRVRRRLGTPSRCDECGNDDPARRYEWANLTGNYADVSDYKRMCKPCHQAYDIARRPPKPIDHGTHAGWLAHRRQGESPCETCRLARNDYARERYRARMEADRG